MDHYIYMDHAATTPLCSEALSAMMPYLQNLYGNPSSLHPIGQPAALALKKARTQLAELIHAKPSEIFFTSGGTESDNWALTCTMTKLLEQGKSHIITSKIEHDAVLRTCERLEKSGFSVTYLDTDSNGLIDIHQLTEAIRPETGLISIMMANNEIGSIQPVRKIGQLARQNGILFHTDAVQAFGHMPIDVQELQVDLLSASAHKFHGPKGIGLLYCRKGTPIEPLLHGGRQERGKRAGTENIPGIIGMAVAADQAFSMLDDYLHNVSSLQAYMHRRIMSEIPCVTLNGPDLHQGRRLANNLNYIFRYTDNESLLHRLSEQGICCSAGSACESGSVEPSHVLLAMGIEYEQAMGSIRFTLGADNTIEEINYTVDKLIQIVSDLRKDSPEYDAGTGQ